MKAITRKQTAKCDYNLGCAQCCSKTSKVVAGCHD